MKVNIYIYIHIKSLFQNSLNSTSAFIIIISLLHLNIPYAPDLKLNIGQPKCRTPQTDPGNIPTRALAIRLHHQDPFQLQTTVRLLVMVSMGVRKCTFGYATTALTVV